LIEYSNNGILELLLDFIVKCLIRAYPAEIPNIPSTKSHVLFLLLRNEVRVLNFANSKNLVPENTTFPHRDIHKHTWTSADGVTHKQIDHVLIEKRRDSNLLDVRSFRGADCDTDHYLVVAELRERISVSK
jgi:hypothetical protein